MVLSTRKACINNDKYKYSGKEESPLGLGYAPDGELTSLFMKGRDTKTWMVSVKNGVKVWIRAPEDDTLSTEQPPMAPESDANDPPTVPPSVPQAPKKAAPKKKPAAKQATEPKNLETEFQVVAEAVVDAETDTTEKPVAEPVEKQVEKPVAEPVAEPEAEPVEKQVEKPVAEPVEKPVAEPVEPVVKPKKKAVARKKVVEPAEPEKPVADAAEPEKPVPKKKAPAKKKTDASSEVGSEGSEKVKRAPTGYQMYMSWRMAELKQEDPSQSHKERFTQVAKEWGLLDADAKKAMIIKVTEAKA